MWSATSFVARLGFVTDVDSRLEKDAEPDAQPSAPRPAHLGVANDFVYCEETHRWLLPGSEAAGNEQPQMTAPPIMDVGLGSGLPSGLHHLAASDGSCSTAHPPLQRRLSLTQRYVDTFHSSNTSEISAACPPLPSAPIHKPLQPPDISAFANSAKQSQLVHSTSQTHHKVDQDAGTSDSQGDSDLRVLDQRTTAHRASNDYSLCSLSGTANSLVSTADLTRQDPGHKVWHRSGETGHNCCEILVTDFSPM